ncbi:MAG: glycosyltransferase family A protein [Thiotrichaceae bacterium]|nr:glycosyltransferase family A protein [Thiotrichaceae bacterium]
MLPKRKVDIILPNYNYAHFLEEALQYISNQTFTDFNLLILDNGSTDSSHDIIRAWQKKDDRITFIINESNLGVMGSLFKGYKLANSKYHMHLPADDRIEPDYLKTTVEALDNNPEAAVAYTTSNMVSIDANMNIVGQNQRYVPHYESGLYNELIYLLIHSHATDYQLVRKAYADEFGSWEGCWNEGSGLYHKISSKYPFYYIKTEKSLIWSFKHTAQVSKQWNKNGIYFQNFVNNYDYIFKNELFPMPIKLLAKAIEYARFTGQPLAKIAEMMLNTRDGVFRNGILPVANEFLYLVADLILSQFHIRNNPNALQQNATYGTVNDAVQILGFLLQKQQYEKAQKLLDYHHVSIN